MTLLEYVTERLKEPTVENLAEIVIGLALGHQVLGEEVATLKKRLRALEPS